MNLLRTATVLSAALAMTLSGCGGKSTPTYTAVEVVVTFNGQPLPNALVTFSPTAAGYGGETVASGITDDTGRATLMVAGKAGAAVGTNRVTVIDAPVPAEARDDTAEAQQKATAYSRGLKNRPIPAKYASVGLTDVTVDVKAGEKEYKIELKR